jgi:hypothetical protein
VFDLNPRTPFARRLLPLAALFLGGWLEGAPKDEHAAALRYNIDVRPILAEHCFKCHGMDEKARKGELRLDLREDAVKAVIVPGKPDESEFVKRILTHNEDDLMPPPKEKRPLSTAQIETLKRWVAEGAPYERHWAFIPPVKPAVPEIVNPKSSIINPLDAFVLSRLEREGLEPAPAAQREDWLRRVTFDLTGLPPTLAEIDAFLADTSEGAFASVVNRLLSSKAYGEQMAVPWLDVARYADTYGRHEDHDCLTWPYRDWVIRAFNSNMPFDQFVIWQTAGDMLPRPTQDMYLATAFNRLPQQSNEAGSNEEEFRQDIIADRVRTNGIAFLGLSLECARCHDHKYDPITMRDYYSMAAFLNNIDECGLYTVYTNNVPAPSLLVYDGEDEWKHTTAKLQVKLEESAREALLPQARERFQKWLATDLADFRLPKPLVHLPFESLPEDKKLENLADPTKPGQSRLKTRILEGHSGQALFFKGDNSVSVAGVGTYGRTQPFSFSLWLKPEQATKRAVVVTCSRAGLDAGSMGYELLLEDDHPSFALCHFWPGNAVRIRARQAIPLKAWTHIACTYDGSSRAAGLRLYVNGLPADCEVVRDNLYKDIAYDNSYDKKDEVASAMLCMGGRHNDNSLTNALVDEFMFWDREMSAVEMARVAGVAGPERSEDWLAWWLREHDPAWKAANTAIRAARDAENKLAMRMKEVMVMRELPDGHRRETHVLARGHFEARTDKVGPDTPAGVFAFPPDLPRTRLGYAQWLVDRRNPLTARVFVNRVWQQFFGRGIVLTSEDFGMQGQLPSHPEMLDWLATWFMDNGWNVKELCRLIVLSSTYRQSSLPLNPALLRDDPDNKLLARGPRVRLSAEQLRDNVLAVSGLLNPTLGGPPVMPYQPAGLWEDSGTQHTYEQSHGADLFRRSCYTFWRRTLPPPAMTVFDAPTREFCKARRDKSASPLQALVLFNDPQFLEPARAFAEKLVRECPTDDLQRAQTACRCLLGKQVPQQTCDILVRLLREERTHFQSAKEDAEALRSKNGEAPYDKSLDAAEVAATAMLVRGLLAFDECVMKP